MKFCPYCGAPLSGGAASFCPECGKSLRIEKAAGTRRRKKRPPQQKSRQAPHHRSRPINPMDVNYDGYYKIADGGVVVIPLGDNGLCDD